MIAPTVSMVPGIVDVRAEVTWAVDDSQFKPSAPDPVFPFGPSLTEARGRMARDEVTFASRPAGRRDHLGRYPAHPDRTRRIRGGVT